MIPTDSFQSQTIEYVRDNIVKVVNKNGRLYGTGFFIEVDNKKYCVTSHHCIYDLETVFLQKGDKIALATWVEELSDMSMDITVLRTKENIEAKPLFCHSKAMSKLPVFLCGFAENENINFPKGRIIENCTLSRSVSLFHWPSKTSKGDKKWNQKPDVNVYVFQLENFFELGHSGSPVCYTVDNKVVGVFIARKEDKFGFVIPIETLLKKVEENKMNLQQSLKVAKSHPQKDFYELSNTGKRFLEEKLYKKAIKHYDKIIYDPIYSNAFFYKAFALAESGKHEEAIEWFDKALMIDPGDAMAILNKGSEFKALGRYEEAIDCYNKALEIDPDDVDTLYKKGWTLHNLNRDEEAIEVYNKALEIDPDDFHSLNAMGSALSKLKRYKEAIDWFDKALAIDPNYIFSLRNKGSALNKLKRYKEAIGWFDKALAIDPNDSISLNGKKVSKVNFMKN